MGELAIYSDLSEGDRVRIARMLKNWRQVDLACFAKVNVADVCAIEKNRYLKQTRKNKILEALGLLEKEPEQRLVKG